VHLAALGVELVGICLWFVSSLEGGAFVNRIIGADMHTCIYSKRGTSKSFQNLVFTHFASPFPSIFTSPFLVHHFHKSYHNLVLTIFT
jgi:hypothetical protein